MNWQSASALPRIGGVAAERAFRLPGRTRRVDHRGAGGGRVAVLRHDPFAGRCGGDQVVARLHAVERGAVEHDDRRHLGDLRPDAGEQCGELGIDDHHRGVAVVDHVRRLVVGEPVVDRHRGGLDLARRVHRLDDARRVLAAPGDLAARPGAEIGEDVGDLIRPGFEFGVGALSHVAAAPVVDHRDLVGLTGCVPREQVGHGRIRTTCCRTDSLRSHPRAPSTDVCVGISVGRPSEIPTQTRI